jgi:hypothetical protein
MPLRAAYGPRMRSQMDSEDTGTAPALSEVRERSMGP